MKILFVYEDLLPPFDEGMKLFARQLCNCFCASHDVCVIKDIWLFPPFLNSLLIVPRILFSALRSRADCIVYIPKQSLTLVSMLKARALETVLAGSLVIVALQDRPLRGVGKAIASLFLAKNICVLSRAMALSIARLGGGARVLPPAIDADKFRPGRNRAGLREKYGIDAEKRVLLHVGHVKRSRNLGWLARIQRDMQDTQVLLIGSTSTREEQDIRKDLETSGVIVMVETIEKIEEIYQLSDWYVFPVVDHSGAMELPLSVLEAMAANLPVVTTRFGSLTELFCEDVHFRYVDSYEQLREALIRGFEGPVGNREKVIRLSWDNLAGHILTARS